MDKTSLGNRMKGYEAQAQTKLMRRTPVVIRVDGKAFHTWTKKIKNKIDPSLEDTPFSVKLHEVMTATAHAMVSQMQNAELAYTQSDEISILLRDWDKHETEQWFNAKTQKIVSIASAMASAYFNFHVSKLLPELADINWIGDIPLFDARAFNLPMEEVTNYFIWRQQDASRNSVQMFGRHYYSHKRMHGKNVSAVQDMLMALDPPVNWNDQLTWMKRGTCIVENPNSYDSSAAYIIDEEIPIFTKDREYVECRLTPEDDWDEMVDAANTSLDKIQGVAHEMILANLERSQDTVVKKGGPYDHITDAMKKN